MMNMSYPPSPAGRATLSLWQRLTIGMGALLAVLLLTAFIGYSLVRYALGVLEEGYAAIEQKTMPVVQLEVSLLRAQMPAHDYLVHGDAAERAKFDAAAAAVEAHFNAAFAAAFETDDQQSLLRAAYAGWKDAAALSREILAIPDPVGSAAGAGLMARVDEVLDAAAGQVDQVVELSITELGRQRRLIRRLHMQTSIVITAMFVIIVFAILAGTVFVRRWILMPLRALRKGAEEFAEGRLEHRVPVHADDEIGRVARTFNQMAEAVMHDRDVMHSLAIQDQLTGLLNVRELYRRLELELARAGRHGHPLAVLMVDADFFKSINDRFGHPAGDLVLRELAYRLRGSLRPSDVAARYGGEEFVVMLPETDATGAMAMCERLRAQVAETPFEISADNRQMLTVSIGIAVYPRDAGAADALIAAADKALYAAKHQGRNRCTAYSGSA
ncbi:MAG: diguanylate cyclase [Gammaproteobacteria bacterium]|nr:diguanylate cyclase [Gammaproteobacteria bacterium]